MGDLVDNLMVVIMMIRRIRMSLEVIVRTKVETTPIISMIRTIEIKEEEAEDKNLEEEASMGNFFHYREEGYSAFECSKCQGRKNQRIESHTKVAHVDEDAKSSHSKDAESGEVLVNRRFLLSGENESNQRRSLFFTR